MIEAAKKEVRKNLASKLPLDLYGTSNGVHLRYASHFELIFKSAFAEFDSFFTVEDAGGQPRLRTEQDPVQQAAVSITLDGVACGLGHKCVNICTGDLPHPS